MSSYAPVEPASAPDALPRFVRWRRIVFATCFISYVCMYFARTNLTVSSNLMLDEAVLTKTSLGWMISLATFAYGLGKACAGPATGVLGARKVFVFGLSLSLAATVLFALGSGSWLVVCWIANRFAQSLVWGQLVQSIKHWFRPNVHGTVVAGLTLSFLFGDAIARLVLGGIVSSGVGWRGIFWCAAGILAAACVGSFFTFKPSPTLVGLPAITTTAEAHRTRGGNKAAVRWLVRQPVFYVVCCVNAGINFMREVFRDWMPVFLKQTTGADSAQASMASVVYPLAGAIAAVLSGWLSDRLPGRRRGLVMLSFLGVGSLALFLMWYAAKDVPVMEEGETSTAVSFGWATFLIFLVGLGLYGPYSFMSTLSIDLTAGAHVPGNALALFEGLQDSAGYFAASSSGVLVGNLAETKGWGAALMVVFGMSLATLAFTALFSRIEAGARGDQSASGGVGSIGDGDGDTGLQALRSPRLQLSEDLDLDAGDSERAALAGRAQAGSDSGPRSSDSLDEAAAGGDSIDVDDLLEHLDRENAEFIAQQRAAGLTTAADSAGGGNHSV